eukprot:508673_1
MCFVCLDGSDSNHPMIPLCAQAPSSIFKGSLSTNHMEYNTQEPTIIRIVYVLLLPFHGFVVCSRILIKIQCTSESKGCTRSKKDKIIEHEQYRSLKRNK